MVRRPLTRTMRLVTRAALAALAAGCTSNDASSSADAAAESAAAVDLCDTFTHAGDPCARASAKVCFAECVTGGCACVAGEGGPRWKCTTDLSCVPDASPADFDAHPVDPDAADVPDTADAADASEEPGDADAGPAGGDGGADAARLSDGGGADGDAGGEAG